jgi:hypothetical protein
LAILFRPFTPNDFYIIWLSILLIISIPDDGYYRNIPDDGYYRNIPDDGYYRNIPDDGYFDN